MQDKLRALIRLAEIDAKAHGIDGQLEGIPRELEERRAAVRALEALVNGQGAKLADAERLLAQQELELKNRAESLARSKAKSAKARNAREAEMAERELESIRRSIKDAEAERDRLREVLKQTSTVLDGPRAELAEQKSALAEAERSSEGRLAELRAEREQVVSGREKFANELPKPVLRRYERIRQKLAPATAEVVDDICTACRVRLPAQLAIQVQALQDFHQCPRCQRFIYYRSQILD